jgi:S-adenosylmethionine-diacylgycerolhomoserine-N-methlytransferase
MTTDSQVKDNMDRMYRWTRHVYDASRKYYLLGRDHLIRELKPYAHERVCEIGCGTARNLIKMAEAYPEAQFYGLDASDEMLKTARKSLKRADLNIPIIQAYAQNFDPARDFGLEEPFGKLVFSYSLSMIPVWKETIDHALVLLPSGGQLHIVDFGDQSGLSKSFKTFLFWWLDKFGVHFRPQILSYLQQLAQDQYGELNLTLLYRGYAYHAIFTKK